MASVRLLQLVAAFAMVYLVWGSTYLAIRLAVHSLPPWLMAGVRMLLAGLILAAVAGAMGMRWPRSGRDGLTLLGTATLMLVGGNGLVTWAEQWVPSNQAALIVATSALWMAGFGSLGRQGERLSGLVWAGLASGFAGVALLIVGALEHRVAPLLAYIALLGSPVAWALGSVLTRRRPLDTSPLVGAALQMLISGVIMTGIGLAQGETRRWTWGDPEALGALVYLVLFGSCLAYGAYVWLVHQVRPAVLGTYAYINPAVAVLLGWWWLDEALTPLQWLGTAVILAGVVLVSWANTRRP